MTLSEINQQIDQLQERRKLRQNYLYEMQKKAAKFGSLHVPPHITTEIRDTEAEITGLEAEISTLKMQQSHQQRIAQAQRLHIGDYFPLPDLPASAVRLDWHSHGFKGSSPRRVPSPEVWAELWTELDQQPARLARPGPVMLCGNVSFSTAFGFGFAFNKSTGYHVLAEQSQDDIWDVEAPVPAGKDYPTFARYEASGKAGSGEWLVILHAGRQDLATLVQTVGKFVGEGPALAQMLDSDYTLQQFDGAVVLTTAGVLTDVQFTDWQVAGLARHSFEQLRPLHAQTLHLFMSLPRGLAALLGYWWHTLEPFQCYEYLRDENTYTPTWRIGR